MYLRQEPISVTGRNTSLKVGASYEDHRNVDSVKLIQLSLCAWPASPVDQIESGCDSIRGKRPSKVKGLLNTV